MKLCERIILRNIWISFVYFLTIENGKKGILILL